MIEIDECIIEQCKKADCRAQMQLYAILYKRVYNTCFRIIRNPLEAEEAMQEACRCLRCDHFGCGAMVGGRDL